MEKKRLLILAHFFAPFNTIGAVRPAKLAKYLALSGNYDITVVCAKPLQSEYDASRTADLQYPAKIVQVSRTCPTFYLKKILLFFFPNHEATIGRNLAGGQADKITLKSAARRIGELINQRIDRVYAKRERRAVEKLVRTDGEFDMVFSTYSQLSSLECAMRYKEAHPHCVWIADFRDPLLNTKYFFAGKRLDASQIERQINRSADLTIGVSKGTFLNPDTSYHILTNGFDPDDLSQSVSAPLWKSPAYKFSDLAAHEGCVFRR